MATLDNSIRSYNNADYGALRARFPVGVASDDKNPPRGLFDLSFGADNLFRTERAKVSARLSFINIGNKVALDNFESTFSGTHFVTPRSIQGQVRSLFLKAGEKVQRKRGASLLHLFIITILTISLSAQTKPKPVQREIDFDKAGEEETLNRQL